MDDNYLLQQEGGKKKRYSLTRKPLNAVKKPKAKPKKVLIKQMFHNKLMKHFGGFFNEHPDMPAPPGLSPIDPPPSTTGGRRSPFRRALVRPRSPVHRVPVRPRSPGRPRRRKLGKLGKLGGDGIVHDTVNSAGSFIDMAMNPYNRVAEGTYNVAAQATQAGQNLTGLKGGVRGRKARRSASPIRRAPARRAPVRRAPARRAPARRFVSL
jgi:hypothetical protein